MFLLEKSKLEISKTTCFGNPSERNTHQVNGISILNLTRPFLSSNSESRQWKLNFRFEDIGKDEGSKNRDYTLAACEFAASNIGKAVRIALEIFDCLDEPSMVC